MDQDDEDQAELVQDNGRFPGVVNNGGSRESAKEERDAKETEEAAQAEILMKQHIMIGIPTLHAEMSLSMHQMLMELARSANVPEMPFRFSVRFAPAMSPVEFARNVLVGECLKSDADALLMIDDDMLPDASTFDILHVDADIVVPRMFQFMHEVPDKKQTAGFRMLAMIKNEPPAIGYRPLDPVLGDSAIKEIDAAGTGCILIRRRVLEDRRLWFDGQYTTIKGENADTNIPGGDEWYAPAIFRTQQAPNGMKLMGEDVDFTSRAKALGYRLAVNLNAACGHYKAIIVDQAAKVIVQSVVNAINGLRTGDDVLRVPGLKEKFAEEPPADKMLRRGMTVVK